MFSKIKKYVIGFFVLCGGILVAFLSGKGAGRKEEQLGKLDDRLKSVKKDLKAKEKSKNGLKKSLKSKKKALEDLKKQKENKFIMLSKLQGIVKPCQSGKTAVMLTEIISIFKNECMDDTHICIGCDNSLLQTDQTKLRAYKKFAETYLTEDGDPCRILSSKSDTRNLNDLKACMVDNIKTFL